MSTRAAEPEPELAAAPLLRYDGVGVGCLEMLREWKGVRQRHEEGSRRWFRDDEFDLIVWYDSNQRVAGFQLCYGKSGREHALTWHANGRRSHTRVDDGDSVVGGPKKAPVLVADGLLDAEPVARAFVASAGEVDDEIQDLVLRQLRQGGS